MSVGLAGVLVVQRVGWGSKLKLNECVPALIVIVVVVVPLLVHVGVIVEEEENVHVLIRQKLNRVTIVITLLCLTLFLKNVNARMHTMAHVVTHSKINIQFNS